MLWPYFIASTNFTMCINMSCEDKSHAHEHIRHTTVKRSDPTHGCLFRAAVGRAVEPKDVPEIHSPMHIVIDHLEQDLL